jgi:hypothetical protein
MTILARIAIGLTAFFLSACAPEPSVPDGDYTEVNAEYIDQSEQRFTPGILRGATKAARVAQEDEGGIYRRDAHAKAHGCVGAVFSVRDESPPPLPMGVFQPGVSYQAWIRFSSGNGHMLADKERDARGMAIKLMGVRGEKLLRSTFEKDMQTQDFVMINYPQFFNSNLADYQQFATLQAVGDQMQYFIPGANPFKIKWRELAIGMGVLGVTRLRNTINPVYEHYHSMVPYALGVGESERRPGGLPPPVKNAMKFSAKPVACEGESAFRGDDEYNKQDPTYLRHNLRNRLLTERACFEFQLIIQQNDRYMPIEDPTVEWKGQPLVVADITIPRQQFDTQDQNHLCENFSFTPWHGLREHRPLGSINRVRKAVYEHLSLFRHQANDTAAILREPEGWCVDTDDKGIYGRKCSYEEAFPFADPL